MERAYHPREADPKARRGAFAPDGGAFAAEARKKEDAIRG
jgi:hypothetical protein